MGWRMAGGGGGLVRQLLVDARLLGPDVHGDDAPLSDAAQVRGGAGGGRREGAAVFQLGIFPRALRSAHTVLRPARFTSALPEL